MLCSSTRPDRVFSWAGLPLASFQVSLGKVGNTICVLAVGTSFATSDLSIYSGEFSRMPTLLVCLLWYDPR